MSFSSSCFYNSYASISVARFWGQASMFSFLFSRTSSASQQCFSLTINRPTVISALTFQTSEHMGGSIQFWIQHTLYSNADWQLCHADLGAEWQWCK